MWSDGSRPGGVARTFCGLFAEGGSSDSKQHKETRVSQSVAAITAAGFFAVSFGCKNAAWRSLPEGSMDVLCAKTRNLFAYGDTFLPPVDKMNDNE